MGHGFHGRQRRCDCRQNLLIAKKALEPAQVCFGADLGQHTTGQCNRREGIGSCCDLIRHLDCRGSKAYASLHASKASFSCVADTHCPSAAPAKHGKPDKNELLAERFCFNSDDFLAAFTQLHTLHRPACDTVLSHSKHSHCDEIAPLRQLPPACSLSRFLLLHLSYEFRRRPHGPCNNELR